MESDLAFSCSNSTEGEGYPIGIFMNQNPNLILDQDIFDGESCLSQPISPNDDQFEFYGLEKVIPKMITNPVLPTNRQNYILSLIGSNMSRNPQNTLKNGINVPTVHQKMGNYGNRNQISNHPYEPFENFFQDVPGEKIEEEIHPVFDNGISNSMFNE
ncbi:hypothetical protein M9Y10_011077 [Tritrichomonas musculus]|uniref:Uncharacterized protein n=1 Tax=Tritrichomonas musculus TaxID=1915356 RepID=A0ABR2IMG3_9EUKA